MTTRRDFVKSTILAGLATSFSAKSYAKIIGSNDRVRVACVGFSDRFKASHIPPFKQFQKEMNFEMVGLSDIWNRRRDEGKAFIDKELGSDVKVFRHAFNG
jgi:hypothetical protein